MGRCMERDKDSMFGNTNNIIRACSLAFLVPLLIMFFMAVPTVILVIIMGIVVAVLFCFILAYVIGLLLGWWEYVW